MKQITKAFLIGIFSLFLTNSTYASHYAGAELSYENIGGSSYIITLVFYRDCSGVPALSTATIYFENSFDPIFNFNIEMDTVGTALEMTQSCSLDPTTCSGTGNTAYGIQKVVYQDTVILPPGQEWNIYWKSNARNSISTVNGTPDWYVSTIFNNYFIVNNSPIFSENLIPIATLNELNVFDYGGIDPDGDSLTYSLYSPFTDGPSFLSSIIYLPPYSFDSFLSSSTPITLDSVTGILSFTPDLVLSSCFGIKVEQWRIVDGVMAVVGVTYRDLTINIISLAGSSPVLSGIDTTLSTTYSPNDNIYTINKCFDGNPIVFNIKGYDSDVYNAANTGSPELFNISWNSGISGATLTPYHNGTDSAYVQFYWLPSSSNISYNNSFSVTIKDLDCPYNLSNTYTYNVNLIDNTFNFGNDTTIANNSSITLSMPLGYSNYLWSNGSINNTLVIDNSFNWINNIIGTASVGNCVSTDTIVVYIGSVGINDSKNTNIKVYPNPIDDVLNITLSKLGSKVKLQLYDVNGKLVRSAEFYTKDYTLKSLGNLAAGSYFMRLNIDGEEIYYSFIKK